MKKPVSPRGVALGFGIALLVLTAVSSWRGGRSVASAESPAGEDLSLRAVLERHPDRMDRLRLLIEKLAAAPDSDKPLILDVLADLRPIEAVDPLAAELENAGDPALAARILRTLRAATLVTSSEERVDLKDPELARAFESVQQVFRDELARPKRDAARFREAVAAIADVFPGAEAERIFASLALAWEASPETFPLSESDLFGRWLELQVGDVERRDFGKIREFVKDHPQAIADERVKARVIEQLSVTSLSADEIPAMTLFLELLVPAEAPDDSFVRWLEVKQRLTGAAVDPAALFRSCGPMRQSALVLYGRWHESLSHETQASLKRGLMEAASSMPESGEKDFLQEAAGELP